MRSHISQCFQFTFVTSFSGVISMDITFLGVALGVAPSVYDNVMVLAMG